MTKLLQAARWAGDLARQTPVKLWKNHLMPALTLRNAFGACQLLFGAALVIGLIASLSGMNSAPTKARRNRYRAQALIFGVLLAWITVATTPTFSFAWSITGLGATWFWDARKRRNELLGQLHGILYVLAEYRRDFK